MQWDANELFTMTQTFIGIAISVDQNGCISRKVGIRDDIPSLLYNSNASFAHNVPMYIIMITPLSPHFNSMLCGSHLDLNTPFLLFSFIFLLCFFPTPHWSK